MRLATFNIWHNQGDWTARRPLLVAALKAQDADVIALQEVLQDAAVGLENQAEMLARELGGYRLAFVSTDPEGAPRRYGNALLTRLPVLAEASTRLAPLDDYRTALRLRVSVQGRPVDVVVTHLAWQDDAGPVRARQIASLLDWLPHDGAPLVVMGDFNATQDDSGLSVLTGPTLLQRPAARIDRHHPEPGQGPPQPRHRPHLRRAVGLCAHPGPSVRRHRDKRRIPVRPFRRDGDPSPYLSAAA